MKLILLVVTIIFSSHVVWSQDSATTSTTVVPVEGTKVPVLKFEVVDSNFESTEKIVIDQEAIQKSRSTNVAQVLANQANINVVSTSIQPNSIFIRGGDSGHVLILIDDIPTYDSSTLQRTFNLGTMNVSNIKRIEVLKGSQAVLYGGQALSAVIKIYTIPEEFVSSAKIGGQLRRKMGSDANANFNYKITEDSLVGLDVRASELKNQSPVLKSEKTNGYQQQVMAIESTFSNNLSEKIRLTGKLNYSRDKSDLPDGAARGGIVKDADGIFSETKTSGAILSFNANENLKAMVSTQKTDRIYIAPGSRDDGYVGESTFMRLDYGNQISKALSYQLGASLTGERINVLKYGVNVVDDKDQQIEGYYSKVSFSPIESNPDLILVEAGYRAEFKQGQDRNDTGQLGLVFFNDLKLEASSGSRSASLSRQFDPLYGNPNLRDEKALNYNLSYSKKLGTSASFGAAIFDSNYRDLIGTSCSGSGQQLVCQTANISNARVTGGELSMNFADSISRHNYRGYIGYQEPRDLSDGSWLLRRPLRSMGLQVGSNWSDNMNTQLEFLYTGSRRDLGVNSRLTLSEYMLVNLTANYRLQEDLVVYGRIDNLQDKTYETTFGYYVQGAELRAGLEKSF